jgi:hypothetical protein
LLVQWHKARTESPKITAEAKKANTETDRTELINMVKALQTTDETIMGMDVGKKPTRGHPRSAGSGDRGASSALCQGGSQLRAHRAVDPTVPDAHAENYRIVASMEAGFRKRVRAYLPDNA